MGRIEKTVFISYRRANLPWALAIYQNLTAHGYDVFFDYDSIASGDFEQVILGNIRARAHFLVVLTPSALERCVNSDDWLRREIETALDEKRNIVPVFLEGFDFGSPSISKYLTGKLETLKKYNGQNVPAGFFDEAMGKIMVKFLNVPLDAVLHPVSATVQREVKKQQVSASGATQVKEKELTAQEWLEQGNKHWYEKKIDESIYCNTEAIRLKPDYAEPYNNRGNALHDKGDLDGAIKDYTRSIELKNPEPQIPYNNRGNAHKIKGDLDGAIKDYTEAIRLKSDYAEPYNGRGNALYDKGNLDGAIKDYTRSIELKNPEPQIPYNNRGNAHKIKGDLDGAIKDYTEAIRLKSDYAEPYNGRGNALYDKGNLDGAIKDYTRSIELKNPEPQIPYNNRGNAHKIKGDLDGAIKDYTEAIRLKSDYAEPYNGRGNALYDKGNLDGAIKDYTEAIRLKPDFADAYFNRGLTRYAKGDSDGAIKDYTEAIRLKSDYANAYRNRGVAWDNKGDYYSAIADYQKCLELGDKEPTIQPRIEYLRKLIK